MNQYKAVLLLTVILQVICDWSKIVFNLRESSVYSFKFICIWGNLRAANDYSFNIILFDLLKRVFFHHPYTFPKLKEKITGSAVMAWELCYWESKTTVADKEVL